MAVIKAEAKYALKNHVVGKTKDFSNILEYVFYDENLKVIQFVNESVNQIKETMLARPDIEWVSAAWLLKMGAFNGDKG